MLILCLSFFVAVLDQVTKFLVMQHLLVNSHVILIPGLFNLSHVRNTGAAWGMMQGFNPGLILMSVVMLVAIIGFRRRFMADTRIYRIIAGLMIGGIIGNLIDRLRLGFVVDFLDFHWKLHHFPSFNVADSAICIGVGLYILSQLLTGNSAEESSLEGSGKPETRGKDTAP